MKLEILTCIVFNVLFSLCLANEVYSDPEASSITWPKWRWICESRKCVRASGAPASILEQSSETCRLNCDTFGRLWPRPTGYVNLSHTVMEMSPDNIEIEYTEIPIEVHALMVEMGHIFIDNVKKECGENCSTVLNTNMKVELRVSLDDDKLSWTTDESYSLNLRQFDNEISVQITAQTIYGARHGLESLSQLIAEAHTSSGPALIVLTKATIEDNPVYPHRGLMLDSARHFLPMSAILRSIDGMAASKMNVMHWHVTDSQSFPLVSPTVPQLSRYGAYSKSQRYQPSEIRKLMHYAKIRGIRVIIEIDGPAHAGAGWQWGKAEGFGDLVVCWAYEKWRERCIQPPCGQLNPANAHVFHFLKGLFIDVARWMPQGENFHMGGDEVFIPCWNNTEEIVKFMESRGMGREELDFLKLWAEYQSTALRVWDEASRVIHGDKSTQEPVILWSSHLTTPNLIESFLPKDRYVIQTWVKAQDPLPNELLQLGYKLIMSTKDAWYLDHGFWGITTYHPWRKAYDNRIPRVKAVLGGEACMWSEYVDEHIIDGRVWPRTAAVAERLWSDPSSTSSAAEFRFYSHRDRLIRRGIQAEALQPGWCLQNDGKCA